MSNSKRADPTISLVIPTYNRAGLIGECIESALSQTVAVSEIIVVDDGSEDDTEAVVSGFASQDVRYIRKAHTGVADTRNAGVRASSGAYVLHVCSDDVMLRDSVERLSEAYRITPGRDFYYGDLIVVDRSLKPWMDVVYPDWSERREALASSLAFTNQLGDGFGMLKRETLLRWGGYSESFQVCEDWDFWARAAGELTVAHAGGALGCWRWHDSNLSANRGDSSRAAYDHRIRSRMREARSGSRHAECLGWSSLLERRPDKPVVIWGAGDYGEAMLRMLERMEVKVSGFLDSDPKKWGASCVGAPVSGPGILRDPGRPTVVIASVYETEIASCLQELGYVEQLDYYRVGGVDYRRRS